MDELITKLLVYFGNHPMLKNYFDSLPKIDENHPVILNFKSPGSVKHFLQDQFAETWLRASKEHIDVFRMRMEIDDIISSSLVAIMTELIDDRNCR
jgi:hypothetical protein